MVLLDEPTTGQDARGVARLGRTVGVLRAQWRMVIVISPDLDFCAEHCARVVVMSKGEVQADGPAWQVLYQPDLLRSAAVDPPQIARLSISLGYTQAKALSVQHFVDLLAQQKAS